MNPAPNTDNQQLITPAQIQEASRLFGILADSSRLGLLRLLMEGEKTVGQLVEQSSLSQANVSKHLAILHQGKFIARRKEGLFVIYSLEDPTVHELCHLMCGRMAREAMRAAKDLAP